MMRACCVCLALVLVGISLPGARAAILPIEEVKEIDSRGDSQHEGEIVTVTGVVTVGSGTFNDELSTLDAYIQDKTGGINIYTRYIRGIKLRLGDSVVVTGQVNMSFTSPTSGVIRLRIESLEDIEIVGQGTLPQPVTLTASELTQPAVPPHEPYEGILVRIEEAGIVTGEWPSGAGQSTDLTLQDPTGTFGIRIDGDTDIGGTDQPAEPFIVIGVVVQNDRQSPYLSDYNLWPRSRYEDFLNMGNGSGSATLEPSSVDNDVESFDLAVTVAGNSRDTITAFSVDLPLADGWEWVGGASNVELAGPGVSGATYEVTAGGVTVRTCAIWDADVSYGAVILKNMAPPAGLVSSHVIVKTSVDGTTFEDISLQPTLRAVYPMPDVRITEVYPNDGTTLESNAFIELHNTGGATAFLEGYVLSEQRAVPYCDTEVRHVFGPGDSLPADGYLVLVESLAGFNERFEYDAAIEAAISPLGREGGDGGICGGEQTYEVISLWRDASLYDLVDYVEYKNAVTCALDMCDEFEPVAFGLIPPSGYALLTDIIQIPENPQLVLTAVPTPGADNVVGYKAPLVDRVVTHTRDVVEVIFSEPMDEGGLSDPSNFRVIRELGDPVPAVSAYPSISGEKVLLLFDGVAPGSASLRIGDQRSQFDQAMRDTLIGFTISSYAAVRVCTIQDYDANGFSPLTNSNVYLLGFITVPPGVFQPDFSSIYVQGLDGCGINAFSYDVPIPTPALGDFVSVQGDVTEYVSSSGAGSTTEIYMEPYPRVTILSKGYREPDPVVVRTGDIGRELNEGRLMQTEGAIINTSDYDFFIDDGTGGIQVYQNYTPIDFSRFRVGMYVRVKGVVLQYDYTRPFFEGYELVPRYDSDIEIIEGMFPQETTLEVDARVFCPSCGDSEFSIRFGGESLSDVVLRLFDVAGREVRTLYSGTSLGETEIFWDGKGSDGDMVAPGLYVCFLEVTESISGKTTTASAPIVVGIELK